MESAFVGWLVQHHMTTNKQLTLKKFDLERSLGTLTEEFKLLGLSHPNPYSTSLPLGLLDINPST
jgi:hypothetical protein